MTRCACIVYAAGPQAIDSLIAKSGCVEPITTALRERLSVFRFTSTKCTLPFAAYLHAMRKGQLFDDPSLMVPTPRASDLPTPREAAHPTPRPIEAHPPV